VSAERPTTYTKDMLKVAGMYAEDSSAYGDTVPTVVGLCGVIKRSKSTVYKWCSESDKAEFSDIVREIEEKQEAQLIKGGLSGIYNASITKLLLSKHGYSDKQELDVKSSDGSMSPTVSDDDLNQKLKDLGIER